MPKTKKKFIDRKSAVTFNLVHRSQRDPLAADETAPQRVLVPVNANVPAKKESNLTPDQRKEVQRKYGIYYDDDYNYLQHLKDTKEVTMVVVPKTAHKKKEKPTTSKEKEIEKEVKEKLMLPSSVFASEVEEDVGLLNKAAPLGLCLDLDPDVVAALDEDYDYENPDNQLEDNFIELAMAKGSESDEEEYSDVDSDDDDAGSNQAMVSDGDSEMQDSDDDSQDGPRRLKGWDNYDEEETRSRFTEYSMSSSVTQRNKGLTLLDNRFEKMFAEYDDTELGALDCDDIEGFLPHSHSRLLAAAEEFHKAQEKYTVDKAKELARLQRLQEIKEESSEDELVTIDVTPTQKWDCESILSTYSNVYNHPKLIEEPKKPRKISINNRTGIPKDILGTGPKLTMKSLAQFNAQNNQEDEEMNDESRTNADTVLSTLSILSIRPKDEGRDDKRDRKRLIREYRKERRIEKKANKEAFKEEKKRQEKIMLNNRVNVQGNKIL